MNLTIHALPSLSARLFNGRRILAKIPFAAGLTLAVLMCQSALAAPINYGNFVGNTVAYMDVTEDSNSGDPVPLFGAPTLAADSITFSPVGFSAASANGAAADITDGNLVFEVHALPGFAISNLSLSELGDTTMAGNVAPGSMATSTTVSASGALSIFEVDGVAANATIVPFSFTFNPSGGTYFLGTDGGGGPVFNTQWSGSLFLDLDAILVANSIPFQFGVTKMGIDLDNTLTATSEQGTSALIAKKNFGGVSVAVNIPEPGSCLLATLGMIGLAMCRRSAPRRQLAACLA